MYGPSKIRECSRSRKQTSNWFLFCLERWIVVGQYQQTDQPEDALERCSHRDAAAAAISDVDTRLSVIGAAADGIVNTPLPPHHMRPGHHGDTTHVHDDARQWHFPSRLFLQDGSRRNDTCVVLTSFGFIVPVQRYLKACGHFVWTRLEQRICHNKVSDTSSSATQELSRDKPKHAPHSQSYLMDGI